MLRSCGNNCGACPKSTPNQSIERNMSIMAKSNSDVNRISVSAGNTKMGAIRSFSLPPIQTCPKHCPCATKCYAAKICRLRPSVRTAYQRNYDALQNDAQSVFEQLDNELRMNRYQGFLYPRVLRGRGRHDQRPAHRGPCQGCGEPGSHGCGA